MLSPPFKANEFVFSLSHTIKANSSKPGVGIYLQAHPVDYKHWPTAQFRLGLRCIETSLPNLQEQCSICPAAPMCQWKETQHSFSVEEMDWGWAKMHESLDEFTAEDTLEYWVCFKSLDHAPCSISSSIELFANQQTLLNTAQFWDSANLSDCTVCTEDGKMFRCHKYPLCAASPVLCSMFTTSAAMADASSNSITFKEADPVAVEILLKFIYRSTFEVPCHLLVALYKLADQYQVAGLKQLLLQVGVHTTITLLGGQEPQQSSVMYLVFPASNVSNMQVLTNDQMTAGRAVPVLCPQNSTTATAAIFVYGLICYQLSARLLLVPYHQELQATPFLSDATATLLPQSHILGAVAELLTACLIKQAADHVQDVIVQQAFVQHWQLTDAVAAVKPEA